MKKKSLQFLIIGGIITAIIMIIYNLLHSGYCPPLFNTPACVFVLISFIFCFYGNSSKRIPLKRILFFIGTTAGLLMAVYFSYNKIFSGGHCPLFLGIPLCFVSLLTFSPIAILKLVIKK